MCCNPPNPRTSPNQSAEPIRTHTHEIWTEVTAVRMMCGNIWTDEDFYTKPSSSMSAPAEYGSCFSMNSNSFLSYLARIHCSLSSLEKWWKHTVSFYVNCTLIINCPDLHTLSYFLLRRNNGPVSLCVLSACADTAWPHRNKGAMTFDHQNLIVSYLTPNGCFCQTWRNSHNVDEHRHVAAVANNKLLSGLRF